MRSFLAGLVFLLILTPGAMAQVTGFVQSIGVQGKIRPDCWVPMRVNLTSTISDPAQYQLQVWQDDLDRDQVVYTKEITLSPKTQERFEIYFVPQQSLGREAQINPGAMQSGLHVRVCLPPDKGVNPRNAKAIIDPLPANFSAEDIDPKEGEQGKPGKRLVLFVTDGSTLRSYLEYHANGGLGLVEQIEPAVIRPEELGENVLFYDAVDAVVWLGGNADTLNAGGSHRLEALQQFVRQGGKLIVCQPADSNKQKIAALGPMLPVELKDKDGNWQITYSHKDHLVDTPPLHKGDPLVDALPKLAQTSDQDNPGTAPHGKTHLNWHLINSDGKTPISIVRPKLRSSAIVAFWEDWSATDRSPYIVRGPFGLGCVTWVAQDLGDINLNGPNSENWPHIWDYVIGWRNDTFTKIDAANANDADNEIRLRENGLRNVVDLSKWMLRGTDYTAKGAEYVFLAIFFFLGYWFVAGPGSYFFLASKKRKEWSWFVFAACAIGATGLTVLLVRFVLSGNAEAKHLTVVRQSVGDPTYVYSRVGLYIPRDGYEELALNETTKDTPSHITPLQEHPQYLSDTNFPAPQVYEVPVHDDPQPVHIQVPFRSTLKKLQMGWVGDMKTGISGSAKLIASQDAAGNGDKGVISGTLTNDTGNDLKNIYFVFHYLKRGEKQDDMVLFVPSWGGGKALDLNKQYASAQYIISGEVGARPSPGGTPVKGPISRQWERYWTQWGASDSPGGDARGENDFGLPVPQAFPILSLFDRIAPGRNLPNMQGRVDFLRRGGTLLNMSSAVAAGRLVVLAQSATDEAALPFPLMVEGSRVGGSGRVLYQFALPVDRTEMEKDAAKHE